MSKDIWHTAYEAPDPYKSFVIKTDKGNIYTGVITNPTEWNPMILPEFYGIDDIDKAEHVTQYAYLDDLLALETKLERTRKQLDVATKALNKIANTDIKVIEKEPLYYARAMFSATNIALGRIQEIKQIGGEK